MWELSVSPRSRPRRNEPISTATASPINDAWKDAGGSAGGKWRLDRAVLEALARPREDLRELVAVPGASGVVRFVWTSVIASSPIGCSAAERPRKR